MNSIRVLTIPIDDDRVCPDIEHWVLPARISAFFPLQHRSSNREGSIVLTEERRHKMIESFKETNGEETAMALAESLFSNDFATKDDIRLVKDDIKSLDAKLDRHFGWLMGGILGSYGAIIAALGIGIAVVINTS